MKLQVANSTGKYQFEYNPIDFTLSANGELIKHVITTPADMLFVAESEAAGICFREVN